MPSNISPRFETIAADNHVLVSPESRNITLNRPLLIIMMKTGTYTANHWNRTTGRPLEPTLTVTINSHTGYGIDEIRIITSAPIITPKPPLTF